jgi:sugar phosphate isomerase/epimerase
MMKKKAYTLLVMALLITYLALAQESFENTFYCFNNGVRTLNNPPHTFDEQAALIKKIGFDGLAGHNSVANLKLRSALDRVGLEMPEVYFGMTLTKDGKISYNKQLKKIMKNSKGRDLLVALTLGTEDKRDGNQKDEDLFVGGITELADFAAVFDVKIAIYPHINNYCERLDHALSISEKVNRKNVGIIFNLCHLFKVEGDEGWDKKILKALPNLFMVSINGTDSGDTQNMNWDQLIQPLGEGDFDTYKVVKLLLDNGYTGLFGLQCYNINQDCETALTKSMNTWRFYQEKYRNEK